MKNILFPTDFSETSRQALKHTLSLADKVQAKTTIMNVYQDTNSSRHLNIEEGTVYKQVLQKVKEFAQTSVEKERLKKILFKAKEGLVIRNIIEESKRRVYDLIVMNKRKDYNWLTRFLGVSVTLSMCEWAYSPVLVLPQNKKFSGMDNILIGFGTNRHHDRYVRNYFDHFAGPIYKNLHFLPIVNPSKGSHSGDKNPDHADTHKEPTPSNGNAIKDEIHKYIKKHQIDLLVLPITRRNLLNKLFGNHYTYRMAMELDIPILVINNNTVRHRSIKPHLTDLNNRINLKTELMSATG